MSLGAFSRLALCLAENKTKEPVTRICRPMADLVDCATEPLKQAAAKAIGGKKDGHVCYIVHRLGK